MGKKTMILAGSLALIVVIFLFVLLSRSTNIKDEQTQNELKNELNLDIVVNLENYSSEKHDETKLLDVAMQLATEKGLLQEYNDENTYFEYVSKDDLHSIIFELTGITVDAPIEIEDFYYIYDSENEFYYYIPASPSYYKINKINTLKQNGDNFEFNCSIVKTVDAETSTIDNVTISITKKPENSIIKYMVNNISFE